MEDEKKYTIAGILRLDDTEIYKYYDELMLLGEKFEDNKRKKSKDEIMDEYIKPYLEKLKSTIERLRKDATYIFGENTEYKEIDELSKIQEKIEQWNDSEYVNLSELMRNANRRVSDIWVSISRKREEYEKNEDNATYEQDNEEEPREETPENNNGDEGNVIYAEAEEVDETTRKSKTERLQKKIDELLGKISDDSLTPRKKASIIAKLSRLQDMLDREITLQEIKQGYQEKKQGIEDEYSKKKEDALADKAEAADRIDEIEYDLKKMTRYDYKSKDFMFTDELTEYEGTIDEKIAQIADKLKEKGKEDSADKLISALDLRNELEQLEDTISSLKKSKIEKQERKDISLAKKEAAIETFKTGAFPILRRFGNWVKSTVSNVIKNIKQAIEDRKSMSKTKKEAKKDYRNSILASKRDEKEAIRQAKERRRQEKEDARQGRRATIQDETEHAQNAREAQNSNDFMEVLQRNTKSKQRLQDIIEKVEVVTPPQAQEGQDGEDVPFYYEPDDGDEPENE